MKNDKDTSESPEKALPTDDVASYFTWANLEGSKYRDYSASREKSRADAHDRNELERSKAVESPTNEAKNDITPRRTPPAPRKLTTMPGGRRLSTQRTNRPPTQMASSRWVALKGTLDADDTNFEEDLPAQKFALPALAFVSLAGGTGKTGLTASIGCLLAAAGVSSLLVDTHIYGLLPLFFGARELSPGASRTFTSADSAPVRVMTMDSSPLEGVNSPLEQIAHHAEGVDRILIDVSTGSLKLLREILPLSPTVLVVLAPNMASVVSLQTMQGEIQQMEEEANREIQTFFVLNQFDASLRLHRDVRDRLTRQLGKRFLPFAIRRSNAVSEALAEGMTIVDYAPDSQTVEDLRDLAQWARELDEPAMEETQNVRWRQR